MLSIHLLNNYINLICKFVFNLFMNIKKKLRVFCPKKRHWYEDQNLLKKYFFLFIILIIQILKTYIIIIIKLNKKKFGKSSAIASRHAFSLLEENILPSTDGKALHSSISYATDHNSRVHITAIIWYSVR
jgi:hypothetical protein